MKLIVSVSVLLVILVLLLPVFVVKGALAEPDLSGLKGTINPEASEPIQESEEAISPIPVQATPASLLTASEGTDLKTSVRVLTGGKVETMSMYDYLVCVVAAEMPASFYGEALKAQAVAARTYTYYKMLNGSNHDNADICDDYNCCKAYLSYDTLKEKWKDKYDFNIGIISAAVAATDGICVTYNSEPILAAFHSSSSGCTEDSSNVWSSPLPYLVSVESPEGGASVPNYYSELKVSFEEFKSTVKKSYASAVFDDEHEGWIANAEFSSSGRLIKALVGNVEMTGTELRKLFGLRSTAISWSVEEEGFCFKVTGYGHGVGMSQYGANEFARNGASFEDILKYYYQGTQVESYILLKSEKKEM